MRKKHRVWLAALVVAALALGAYANSLTNGFTFDDYLVIVNNPSAWRWPGWRPFFTREYFDLTPELSYRPVCTLSYYFDYFVLNAGRAAGRATAHHLSSVLTHAACAVLLLFLTKSLGAGDRMAFFAAALFAVHPVGSETVNSIGFREDMLAFGFVAAALLCRQRVLANAHGRAFAFAGMALFAAAGALSKETGVLAPALALLCDAARGFPRQERKLRWATVAALGVVALGYMLVRFGPMSRALEGDIEPWGGTRLHALLGSANVMLLHARLLLLPLGLNLEHTPPSGRELGLGGAAPGMVFVALWALLMWRARRRRPLVFFGMAWCALWLLPVANIVPIANPMAERYLYGPLAGFCVLLALAFRKAAEGAPCALAGKGAAPPAQPGAGSSDPARRRVAEVAEWALLAVAVASFSLLTVLRNPDWRHERSLYKSAIRANPASSRAQNNLGDVYLSDLADEETRERFEGMAVAQFGHALAHDPNNHSALFNLGLVWSLRREYARALPYFERAVALVEEDAVFPWTLSSYHHQLGIVRWNLGEHEAAARHFRIATREDPRNQQAKQDLKTAEDYLRRRG